MLFFIIPRISVGGAGCVVPGWRRGAVRAGSACIMFSPPEHEQERHTQYFLFTASLFSRPHPHPLQFLLACSAKRALSQGFLSLTSVHLPTSCLPEIQGRPPIRPLPALSMPNQCSIKGCCWHSSPPKGYSLMAPSSTHLNPSQQLPRSDEPRGGRLNCSLNDRQRVILYEAPSKLLTIISVHIRQPGLCFNLR